MTQHLMHEHEMEDSQTLRSLGLFVGYFATFAVLLALGVSIFAP